MAHPFVARPALLVPESLHLTGVDTSRRREEETLLTCRVPRFAALLVLAAAVLAGCTPSTSVSSPTPAVSVTTASPTPTLSEGQKAANDVVVKYRALIDQLRAQDMPDSARLATVARDSAYEKWTRVLQDDFVSGYHQTGVAAITIKSTDPGASARQWLVSGCLDVTKLDVVDKAGKTTLEHPGGINHAIFVVDQDPTTLRWYVTNETFDGGSC
jgi:hypothetical protein